VADGRPGMSGCNLARSSRLSFLLFQMLRGWRMGARAMTVSTKTARTPDHAAHKGARYRQREQDVLWDMEEHFWTSGADSARSTTARTP
jgi:hypothetical protein